MKAMVMGSMGAIDMSGMRCGNLTVICRTENSSGGNARWKVRCDCGKEIVVEGRVLRKGTRTHCGCLREKAYTGQKLCEYCGNPVMNRIHRFCSPSCSARARFKMPKIEVDESFNWKQTSGLRWKCRYGYSNVSCENRDCAHCGWNPEVAEKRSAQILKKLTEAVV